MSKRTVRNACCVSVSALVLVGVGWSLAGDSSSESDSVPANHPRKTERGKAFQLKQFQVVSGTADLAKAYYRDKISLHLNFLTPNTIELSSIKDLLEYFGYEDITAKDLHRLSSSDLMQLSADGDILATRFFAPKITDVAEHALPAAAGGFGWRKLVRLKAKAGSNAEMNNMEMLFILQNVLEATATGDPFNANKNFSKFNQAIVVRKGPGPFNNDKNALYFFAYRPLVKVLDQNGVLVPFKDKMGNFQDDGGLALNLNATFDETDRVPETNSPPSEYFVPDSCAKCHGNSRINAKLNYLDTDHWFDRVAPNYGLNDPKYKEEDFTALTASPFALLYDSASKDPGTEEFKEPFGVVRRINEEIRDQNNRLPSGTNFQLAAVTKWLDLHRPEVNGAKYVPPPERGFGAEPWDSNNETHKKLLYYLNRYCYRCHSSVKYNVFDRTAVKSLATLGDLQSRVQDVSDPERWMPQDRIFPGLKINMGAGEPTGDLKEFLELLDTLVQE